MEIYTGHIMKYLEDRATNINPQNDFKDLLQSKKKLRVKLGVDIDAAIISEGVGYSAESTIRLADVYSFSDNKGLFLGGSLEGSYLQPRNDLNFAFHNRKFNSDEIIEDFKVNKGIGNLENIISYINE